MQVSWLDFEWVEGLASEKVPVLDVVLVCRWDLELVQVLVLALEGWLDAFAQK